MVREREIEDIQVTRLKNHQQVLDTLEMVMFKLCPGAANLYETKGIVAAARE